MPPIYQPEVAARAIVYAADHPRRREYWVGASTVATLVANALSRVCSTATSAGPGSPPSRPDSRRPPDQPANLWEPADGEGGRDFGAHGAFDGRAKPSEPPAVGGAPLPAARDGAVGIAFIGALAAVGLARRR